ncbi:MULTISPECIES: hypothetical protein [unclassified Nocardia]|nr:MULTISPECIES: hypothetical protein [unclassified Nocardia]
MTATLGVRRAMRERSGVARAAAVPPSALELVGFGSEDEPPSHG